MRKQPIDANPRGLIPTLRDVRRTRLRGERAIEARGKERLARIIAHARAESTFYKNRYQGLPGDFRTLRYLPPVTKSELMDGFDGWVTDPSISRRGVEAFIADTGNVGGLFLDRCAVWKSSGTSGEPGIFVHDPEALNVYAALAILRGFFTWMTRKDLISLLRQDFRVGILISTGGHWASNAVKELVRGLHPFLSGHIYTYSVRTSLPQIVEKLNQDQPTILISYPTALALLTQEQLDGPLSISPILVGTIAEWFTPGARTHIAEAFGCKVREAYAASEFMGIAYACEHERLHVNADWVLLEPVDETYAPVPPGQASHTVLLTNLANRVQPLIRYDLGDSITEYPDRCPCGDPLPSIQVEGRQDDVLYLRALDGSLVPVLPMTLATIVEAIPGVARYQIIQTTPTTISLRFESPEGSESLQARETVVRSLYAYLESMGLRSIRIEVSSDAPLRDPVSGKYRQVWANLESNPSR